MKAKNYCFGQAVRLLLYFGWMSIVLFPWSLFSVSKQSPYIAFFPFYTSVWGLRKSLLPEMRCCIARSTFSVSSAAVTISQEDHTSFAEYEKLLIFSWRIDMKDRIIVLLLYFLKFWFLDQFKFFFCCCCSSDFTILWLVILLWWQSMFLIKMLVFVLKSFALR